jgi:hypothetical protein
LERSLISGTREVTIESTDCVEEKDSAAYNADPCCNKVLGYTKCCAKREIKRTVPSLEAVNATFIALTCQV